MEGGAIEAVLNKDAKMKVFPMIARMVDTMPTIDVGRSRNVDPVCNTKNMQVNCSVASGEAIMCTFNEVTFSMAIMEPDFR